MSVNALDRLLATLDVQVHAFAVLEVAAGARLQFDGMKVVVIHHVLSGTGSLEVEGAAPTSLAPGMIVIVPAGRAQALVAGERATRDVDAARSGSMLVDGLLKFDAADGGAGDLRVVCATLTATYSGSFGLFDQLTAPLPDDTTDAPLVRAALELVAAERAQPDIGTHALISALMKQCLILIVRRHLRRGSWASPFFASLADTRLVSAVALVLERPGAPLSLADLAGTAGMSRSAFAKSFNEAFGQTPMDFVQKTRLYRAAHLLAYTELPVKVIAASLGFGSRSHFSRAFRRAYGDDPTGYRKHHSRNPMALPANAGRSWFGRD